MMVRGEATISHGAETLYESISNFRKTIRLHIRFCQHVMSTWGVTKYALCSCGRKDAQIILGLFVPTGYGTRWLSYTITNQALSSLERHRLQIYRLTEVTVFSKIFTVCHSIPYRGFACSLLTRQWNSTIFIFLAKEIYPQRVHHNRQDPRLSDI